MRVTCPNCGGPHPKWDCRKPVKLTIGHIKEGDLAKPFIETHLKFDKKAYQREYMRMRRANAKEKGKSDQNA